MPSTRKTTYERNDIALATKLRQELTEFATSGSLADQYQQQRKLMFEVSDTSGDREAGSVLDWFLFDWFDERGHSAIDYFLAERTDLSGQEKDIVTEWKDSISSVFEITTMGANSLRLRELDSGDSFAVNTVTALKESGLKRGQFIAARLLPFGARFIFAGPQFIMPDREAAFAALEMRRALDDMASPEALETARQEQCTSFCEFFGATEITIPASELNVAVERFQRYIFFERRDPDTNQTMADKFRSEFGCQLNMLELPPPPEEGTGIGEVTILCDEFEGILVLPDFNKFKRVFESGDPDGAGPDWQDLVWNYIKDPDIPIVAFERVAETHPENLEKVLRVLFEDPDFSIEHLYAALLHYKEPVEGLEALEDDQRLWDLFDGNARISEAPAKARATARSGGKKTAAAKKASPSKPAKSASKKSSAKKSAGKKAAAPAKKTARGSAAKKSPSRTPVSKKSAGAKKSPAARSAAKKSVTKKPAKKTTVKKAAAKKPAAKKPAAKKATARKASARKR